MKDYDREELLLLTPEQYLSGGYRGPDGRVRPELRADFATAAATQLLAAECSPEELSFAVAAIHELLPLHHEATASERLYATLQEADELLARTLQQPLSEALRDFLYGCGAVVEDDADLDAFLDHLDAVQRQYALLAAMVTDLPPEEPPPTVH